MQKQELKSTLKKMTTKLLEMTKKSSYNTISNNCLYILSERKDGEFPNFFEERKQCAIRNKKKQVKLLDEILNDVHDLYPTIYEISLEIFHAKKDITIIEILYITFDEEFRIKRADFKPLLHCKIPLPPYRSDEKVDINWHL